MSLEFDSPPLTRRERREREQQLIGQGVKPDEAITLASGNTGVISLDEPLSPPPSAEPTAAVPAAGSAAAPQSESLDEPAQQLSKAEVRALSRRALRTRLAERAEREQATGSHHVVPTTETVTESVTETVVTETVVTAVTPVIDNEPLAVLAVERDEAVVEIVEQIFSQDQATAAPPAVPTTPNDAEDGPSHWADALSLPVNIDPTDPASLASVPALASDTSTIVLDEMPGTQALANQTSEVDLMVTGSILLPTELTETGALPNLLDTEHVEQNEDISDEVPLSSLSPKSASAAVSSGSEPPAMIAEPQKERLSAPVIIAISAGGLTAVVLIAFAVGAIFNLF